LILTEHLIGQLGYVGIALILVLGGLGLPIPEEAPIIVAAVLARNDQMKIPLALASCLGGVLLGDLVVYFLGFFYGEKVLSLPVTRRLLTRQREAQIKGYFHRHGFKILVLGRFAPGFRTAAYLTAGILKLPTLKLLLTDLVAASLSTSLMFGLGYYFAHQIQTNIRALQYWLTILVAVGLVSWLLVRHFKAQRQAGLPIGPPVLDTDFVPLPETGPRGTAAHSKPSFAAAPGTAGAPNEPPPAADLAGATPPSSGADAGVDPAAVTSPPPPSDGHGPAPALYDGTSNVNAGLETPKPAITTRASIRG
jgi:membrane protein DedA with SNARE-associated domain